LVQPFELPKEYARCQNVAILGMGGSAIGADLARSLALDAASVPIAVNREYTAPAYIGPSSLVIASSFSGNTEETLSALEQCLSRGAKCAGVGTGGKLEQRCREAGLPFLKFSYKAQPRAALGYSLICLAGILMKAGIAPLAQADLDEALNVMYAWQREVGVDVPLERNAAKQMATRLQGSVPFVYGSGLLSEVARRWKGQVNENAKGWASFDVMPELNHNAILGYRNPALQRDKLAVIMLRSKYDHPRVGVRYDVTAEVLRTQGVPLEIVEARGDSPLAQMLSIIHFGDYVSLYLAYLYDTDPTPVTEISYLKERLAKA
jgi:glucose/mannose-6-phosphate isomerase